MIPVTASFDVAASCEEMKINAESLVKAAETAIYRAKEQGRKRLEVAYNFEVLSLYYVNVVQIMRRITNYAKTDADC
jgi:hypothetical protein